MTDRHVKRGFDWEAAGRRLGETLHSYYAVVVIGSDPVATGRVAVGVARGQSMHRRVAVGDLFAESPPIQELVQTDDPHGLVDSFLYGVSLSRIAHQVPDAGQLFVMPSGSEPPIYDEMLPNPRWHRLTAGFREVGALLILAAPSSAPHIEDLVAAADGAILVGDAAPRLLPLARVIAAVREPSAAVPPEPTAPRRSEVWWKRRRVAAGAGAAVTLALAGTIAWLAYRPLATTARPTIVAKPDTIEGLAHVLSATSPDTAVHGSGPNSAAATVGIPVVTNPADSASAAPFGVELLAANTQSGAILYLQRDGKYLPAATFAPVLIQGTRWYKVIGGAYASRAGADSLLLALKRGHVLDPDRGSVVRLPFAFLIDSAVPAAAVSGMVATYADRGQPVYALRQLDGTAWLLAGAFESPEQSALYAESLRGPGPGPVLVYRKGRMF